MVAVNAASAYHAGGGFQTGGRHALEEAMCWALGKSVRVAVFYILVGPHALQP